MTKATTIGPTQSGVEADVRVVLGKGSGTVETTPSNVRFEAVMQAAAQSGLLGEKSARIGGRISPALIERAKQQTGIETDTDLIEFALANVALADNFGRAFRKTRGTVDPALKLGF